MSDKPKIPHAPRTSWNGVEKQIVRKLAEAGKLSGRMVRIPHYGYTDEPKDRIA